MLKLLVTAGSALGAEIQVDDDFEIGRHAEAAGRLAGDVEISRRHARIVRDSDGSYAIEDLGSMNGTQVNGRRIEARETLAPGDTIEVGATTMLVQQAPASAQAAEPRAPQPTTEVKVRPEGPVAPLERPAAPSEDPAAAAPPGQPAAPPPPEEPAAPPPPGEPAAPAPRPLSVRLEIDFDARTATVALDEGPELELVHRDGRWRLSPSSG